MEQQPPAARIVRFGSFEVDLQEGRLTRGGVRVRLQGQPFQILTQLLQRPGEVVTREEIRQRLWSEETFVGFDDALNTAIGKLRVALGDSAENPKFLETVPRRGYRFVAPVTLPPETLVAPRLVTLPKQESAELETSAPRVPEPDEAGPIAPSPAPDKIPVRRWAVSRIAVVVVLAAAVAGVATGVYRHLRAPHFEVTGNETIMVADFLNTTGEPVFDDSLRQGLEIGLEQSPNIKILPDRKTSLIVRQMGHSPEERITGRTAIEVCQRAGGKVTVQGSIASLGKEYLVGLAAIRCDNEKPVAIHQIQAHGRDEVISALGRAIEQMRAQLGDSLPSIRKYNAPLEQATTSSLDALNAYALALSIWDRKGDRESLPILQGAVSADPNFAQAYGALATVYNNLGNMDLARANAAKAYELRSRVTETEKASIEARYYSYVTGELEKAVDVRAREVRDYPQSAGAFNRLANVQEKLGLFEQSSQSLRTALRLDPTRATSYANLAYDLMATNRVDEASSVLDQAGARRFQAVPVMLDYYWLAFLRNDGAQMLRLLQQPSPEPGVQAAMLYEQANTEAYHGRFRKAREYLLEATNQMERDGDRELAATRLAQAAAFEAEIGETGYARQFIAQARTLSSNDDVKTLTAQAAARLGDTKQAQQLSLQLDKDWPVGTYMQRYWLPVMRAEISLRAGQPSRAAVELATVTPPLEFVTPFVGTVAPLYPAYLRGQAYLAGGDWLSAQTEFQKVSDHRNSMVNFPLGPLARLGLARAYSHLGDVAKARANYQEFFELWKDADANLLILRESKAEFRKLPSR